VTGKLQLYAIGAVWRIYEMALWALSNPSDHQLPSQRARPPNSPMRLRRRAPKQGMDEQVTYFLSLSKGCARQSRGLSELRARRGNPYETTHQGFVKALL